jgi:hypothetical protein
MEAKTRRPAPAPSRSVQRLINMAARLGLNPVLHDVHAGSYWIGLSSTGEFGGFGTIAVGAKSGKVLWGTVYRGNHDQRLGRPWRNGRDRVMGYRGALAELKAYASYAAIELPAYARHDV